MRYIDPTEYEKYKETYQNEILIILEELLNSRNVSLVGDIGKGKTSMVKYIQRLLKSDNKQVAYGNVSVHQYKVDTDLFRDVVPSICCKSGDIPDYLILDDCLTYFQLDPNAFLTGIRELNQQGITCLVVMQPNPNSYLLSEIGQIITI